MNRRMRYTTIRILLSTVITLGVIEGGLRLFDPLGLVYFVDQEVLGQHISPSSRGYMLDAGVYHLSHWTATELPGNVRWIPDNHHGPCKVVFLGDSVTWGYGVNDDQTWVNLVARALPTIDAIDPAFFAYNSENVRGTYAGFPDADAYIYLVIANDDEKTFQPTFRSHAPDKSFILRYIEYLTGQSNWPMPVDRVRFENDMQALTRDSRMTIVGFDNAWTHEVARRYPIHLIPVYTHWISYIDSHPNADGNRQIADAMLSVVKQAVQTHCTTVI